jgi:HlyD family secretion protein
VTWDALPGRAWEGSVTQVPSTVLQRGSRTVGELTLQVDNSDRKLLPNVNVNAVITVARHDDALTVPREAVHQEDGKRYVFQVVGDRIRRKDVETSISNLTLIEITGGIKQGDHIAIGSMNGQPLRDGAAVKTVQ